MVPGLPRLVRYGKILFDNFAILVGVIRRYATRAESAVAPRLVAGIHGLKSRGMLRRRITEKNMFHQNFLSKIRYWDNLTAKWLMRHFYFMFFQIVLVVIFFVWFVNMFNVLDANYQLSDNSSITERILATQSVNITIVVLLVLLNSFWMLFIFSAIQRIGNLLKDISYHLSRLRVRTK